MSLTYKTGLGIALSVFALSGCSHSNPLNQYSHETVGKELLASAVRAEIQLGLAKRPSQAGYYYWYCLDGKRPGKRCEALYRAMRKNLHNKYHGLTISDLQDKKLWSYVKDYYQEAAFNRLPE